MSLSLVTEPEELIVRHGERELLRYVYVPHDAQRESPRPYFHPLRTLAGDLVSLYRPHDHVWHKGIALSLPNVGDANFWGGVTYLRDQGYVQLPNDGAMVHTGFDVLEADDQGVRVQERLIWVTQQGEHWFTEVRSIAVTADESAGAWTLAFATTFRNVSGAEVVMGSPTTQGRENAGYGGLFWRGPRSFTGGRVYVPGRQGGDELMGVRAPWLAFAGDHDEKTGSSTLVFVEASENRDSPAKWFVRSTPFAAVCPAPFFDVEVPVADGESLSYAYAVVVADGDSGLSGAEALAKIGEQALIRPAAL